MTSTSARTVAFDPSTDPICDVFRRVAVAYGRHDVFEALIRSDEDAVGTRAAPPAPSREAEISELIAAMTNDKVRRAIGLIARHPDGTITGPTMAKTLGSANNSRIMASLNAAVTKSIGLDRTPVKKKWGPGRETWCQHYRMSQTDAALVLAELDRRQITVPDLLDA